MDDMETARRRLKKKRLSLVFIKDSKSIFETNTEGLSGFLKAIEDSDGVLAGAAVADKIIGKAAALLCVYSRVKAAFAVTLSSSGLEMLEKHNIRYEFENLTETILNLKKTGKCPFEKLVEDITSPKEAYDRMKRFCGIQRSKEGQFE